MSSTISFTVANPIPMNLTLTLTRTRTLRGAWLPALLLATLMAPAAAHVALAQPQAAAGSSYSAVLRLSHGCAGSATHTVAVQLPAGFRGAKPSPKAGWALSVRRQALAQPYDSHGRRVTEEVVEVVWTARSPEHFLADAWFDEFSVRGQLPLQAGPLWFKLQQLCEIGRLDWTEIPVTGTATGHLLAPAVLLEVLPAATAGHPH